MEKIKEVHDLINDGQTDLVNNVILTEAIDVNQKYKLTGHSLFVEAIINGNIEIVRTMIKMGADLNKPFRKGYTPLHYCVECGQVEIAALLLNHNANIDARDNFGNTPIWYSFAFWGEEQYDKNIISLLLKKGAKMNILNNKGLLPISWINDLEGLDTFFSQLLDEILFAKTAY